MDVQRDNTQGGGDNDRDVYPARRSRLIRDLSSRASTGRSGAWRSIGRGDADPFTADVEQQMGPLAKFEYPINDSVLTVTQIRGREPSPNGRHLAFTRSMPCHVGDLTPARGGVGAQKMSIGNPRRLTPADWSSIRPIWSPDGRYIAYVTWTDTAGGNIYRVTRRRQRHSRSGSRARPHTIDKIAYTRDGSRIMAARGSRQQRMRNFEDFGSSAAARSSSTSRSRNGGEATRVTWIGAGASQEGRNVPHIGPDSSRMYVWAGTEGLVSMRFDGTDRRVVVRVAGPPPPAQPLPPGATPHHRRRPTKCCSLRRASRARARRQQRLPDHCAAGRWASSRGLGDAASVVPTTRSPRSAATSSGGRTTVARRSIRSGAASSAYDSRSRFARARLVVPC
jgi:dipeptidyl aminopeptidase/acylaminoacyl peptidase